MVKRESVAVMGGGIGGLAAAVALARRGVDVTVVERSARIGAQGAGLVLRPDGLRAADALGGNLGTRIREMGRLLRPGEARLVMDAAGNVLTEEALEGPNAPRLSITHSALQRALLDEALTAGAAVLLSTTVESHSAHDGGVTVRMSDGRTLRCAALVAADGVDPVLRRRILPDTSAAEYAGHASVSGCADGSALERRPHTVGGRGVRVNVLPVGGDLLCWTARIDSAPGVWPAKGRARARADLIAALTGWHPPVVDLVRNTSPQDITVADAHDRTPAPRRVDGRVVLLGNAVCPAASSSGSSGSSGREAGTAMEEALALADAVAAHDDVLRALTAFRHEHREPAEDSGGPAAGVLGSGATRSPARPPAPPLRTREAPGPVAESPATESVPRVVLVGGSLRRGSTCDRVAQWCALRCTEQGATVRVFAGADIDFPAYRPGLAPAHPRVGEFLSELRRAHGVVLVSPTYHGTVSGLLKNALDYVNDLDGPAPYLDGRAIGCVAVGAAADGAASTLATLRTISHSVRGWPTPVGVAVSRPPTPPSPDGTVPPEEERLMRMLSQVLWLGRARLGAGQPSFLNRAA